MKIDKLSTTGFGRFVNRSFDFNEGINLVYGSNETGKTTLVTLIEFLLYGSLKDGVTVRKYCDEHEKYIPWSSEQYAGSMKFTLDDGSSLEVQRSFRKNKNEFHLYDLKTGKETSSAYPTDKRGEVLFSEKLFNMTRSVFRNTVMVSQMDIMRGFEGDTDELTAFLLKAVSGTGRDNSTALALNLLESALNKIGKTDRGKRSGELANDIKRLEENLQLARTRRLVLTQKQEELKRLEKEQAMLLSAVENIESSRAEHSISEIRSTISRAKTLQEKISEDEKILEKYAEYAAFPLDRFNAASDLEVRKKEKKGQYEKEANKLEQLESELEEVKEKLKPIHQYCNLPDNASDELIELKTSLQEAEKNILEVQSQIDTEQDKTQAKQERFNELDKLFKALGEKSGEGLQRSNAELDVIEEKLVSCSREIGERANENQRLKSSALNFAMAATFISISAALFSSAGFFNVGFPFYIPLILSVLSAGLILPAFARQRKAKELQMLIQDKEKEYAGLDEKKGVVKREISTFFSLAGVNDTEEFVRLEAEYLNLKELLADNAVLIQQKRLPKLESDLAEIKEKIIIRLEYVGLGNMEKSSINRDIITFRENYKKAFELEQEMHSLRESRDELIAELQQLEVEIEETRHDLKDIYKEANCRNFPEFTSAKEGKVAWNSAESNLKNHRNSLEHLLNNKTLEEYEEELTKLTEIFGDSPEESEQKQPFDMNDLKIAQSKLDENQALCGPLKGEISEMIRENRDVGLIEAELEGARKEFLDIEERRQCLKDAIEGINEASETLHASFAPVLNDNISRMMTRISRDRYNEVMVSDDFGIVIREAESGRIAPVSSLSSGARDQVFFASRIALADALTRDRERMPLFLDDTFVESDQSRLEGMFSLLEEIATQRQILLFTCHEREITMAEKYFGDKMNIIKLQD